MENERIAEVKFLREGFREPVWGLFTEGHTVIGQYTAKTIEKALAFFIDSKGGELKELGFTHIKHEKSNSAVPL